MNDPQLTVAGHLTVDPELHFTPSGVAVAGFTVAGHPRYLDRASGEWRDGEPTFVRCSTWRQLAENVAESLHTGDRVVVVGGLRQQSGEDRETGGRRTGYHLRGDEIGAALRFATVTVTRTVRGGPGQAPTSGEDGWGGVGPVGEPPL